MVDVDDIIDYIKSLKRGFDKDLYQNKIDQLAYVATTAGLNNDDLHTLFKIWLNLSIRKYIYIHPKSIDRIIAIGFTEQSERLIHWHRSPWFDSGKFC